MLRKLRNLFVRKAESKSASLADKIEAELKRLADEAVYAAYLEEMSKKLADKKNMKLRDLVEFEREVTKRYRKYH
ncbi:nucleoid DNA-binding protein [Virgibacillus halotolerans]|uniref:hypothetical protein n=1 Tax=Virgibacillus halotolerans TaxID=1071053 RepID=UPI0019600B99|nr:hypothetical protein [Virgibacillus halotolerans]MBM7600458.1 nucleoid DNA-binding protein [Virgibacillus halotolerans]